MKYKISRPRLSNEATGFGRSILRPLLAGLGALLLLASGCESPARGGYSLATSEQIDAKVQRNNQSRDHVWNHWRYAGSDDQYDYVYEYVPGSVIPYGFRCYKLPKGDVPILTRFAFDPDFGNNPYIF